MKLYDGVEQYIYRKQSSGMEYKPGRSCLSAFQRHAGDIEISEVRAVHVTAFLDAKLVSRSTLHTKHLILLRFFEYWIAREQCRMLRCPSGPSRNKEICSPHLHSC